MVNVRYGWVVDVTFPFLRAQIDFLFLPFANVFKTETLTYWAGIYYFPSVA